MAKLTVSEIARQFNVNVRQVQRRIKKLVSIENGKYLIDDSIIPMLQFDDSNTTNQDTTATDATDTVWQEFTQEQYDRLQMILITHPILQKELENKNKELEYFRNSNTDKEEQISKLIGIFEQRNFIEAKEKKLEQ